MIASVIFGMLMFAFAAVAAWDAFNTNEDQDQ